jgi:hypothetical protein
MGLVALFNPTTAPTDDGPTTRDTRDTRTMYLEKLHLLGEIKYNKRSSRGGMMNDPSHY